MQTNITGICKSDLNIINYDFMVAKQKKIYITICESEQKKILKLSKNIPLNNGVLTVIFFGKQDISCILNKLYTFHVTLHRLKQNTLGNHKIHLNKFTQI